VAAAFFGLILFKPQLKLHAFENRVNLSKLRLIVAEDSILQLFYRICQFYDDNSLIEL
jgi:hypothetical protein